VPSLTVNEQQVFDLLFVEIARHERYQDGGIGGDQAQGRPWKMVDGRVGVPGDDHGAPCVTTRGLFERDSLALRLLDERRR
jgi:hypothetical protein